jgi:hypothetical protein
MSTVNKILLAYSGVLTAALAFVLVSQAAADPARARFDEIDVKRINVRENDGTLRMTISGRDHFPGIVFHGQERPHPDRSDAAGMIFFNDEGTENGGLIFGGKKAGGHRQSFGHLSFDQYDQDQVMTLQQSDSDGRRAAGMTIDDRPDAPIDFDLVDRLHKMPDGPEKTALVEKLIKTHAFGTPRLYLGKTQDRASRLVLKDADGRDRLVLRVDADGKAAVEFLDETGKVIKTVAP